MRGYRKWPQRPPGSMLRTALTGGFCRTPRPSRTPLAPYDACSDEHGRLRTSARIASARSRSWLAASGPWATSRRPTSFDVRAERGLSARLASFLFIPIAVGLITWRSEMVSASGVPAAWVVSSCVGLGLIGFIISRITSDKGVVASLRTIVSAGVALISFEQTQHGADRSTPYRCSLLSGREVAVARPEQV